MLDCRGRQVDIGDTVWIGQKRGVLDEAVFVGETKASFLVKCVGAHRPYKLPKTDKKINPAYWAAGSMTRSTIPVYLIEDISQKPCPRIIKID